MKLIFIDVDGTLTPPGGNVPPQSALDAIRRARAAGNRVFLCSGRNAAMLRPLLNYGFDGYIASAGGYVVCGEKVLYDCPMTDGQRDAALRIFQENGVFRVIEAKDASYSDEDLTPLFSGFGGANSELLRWRKALREELSVRPMREYDGRPAYKIVFMCAEEAQLAPARAALGGEFHFVMQDVFTRSLLNGELINRRFDKGRAIRLVAEELGVPLADTVGFGDSMNDLEMLETAGVGVCMANGSGALRRVSDMVCGTVEDDGLAQAFEKLKLV